MFKKIRNRFFRPKPGTVAYNREMARKLNGRTIKYVTERIDNTDIVIGHSGALIVRGDEFIVFSSSDIVFRAKVDELQASELLSLEGVILTAPDYEHGGVERKIIAYYTYFLKIND
jgi:hypothetical protein